MCVTIVGFKPGRTSNRPRPIGDKICPASIRTAIRSLSTSTPSQSKMTSCGGATAEVLPSTLAGVRGAPVLGLLAATAILAACGSSKGESGTSTAPAPDTTVTSPTSDPMEGSATTPVEGQVEKTGTALLERVAVGRHEGFDRVVFQFENLRPGWKVQYVDRPIVEDGSGDPIEVAGGAVLLVRMEPASGFDLATNEGRLVYKGPRRIEGTDMGTSVVREVVRSGDFEAVLSWAIGVQERVDFRVQALDDPARLVVDVRNR